MTLSKPSSRPLLIGAIAIVLLSQGGCTWIKGKFSSDAKYRDSVQNQPLEVPPGLDLPSTAGAVVVPDIAGGNTAAAPGEGVPTGMGDAGPAPATGSVAGIASFTLADTVDSTWRRVGLALPKIQGVTVGERAQLLNSYEVSYQGSTMLVRVEAAGDQSRVVALGADGRPLESGPGAQLLALLKARLG